MFKNTYSDTTPCGQIIITSLGFSIQFLWIFHHQFWMGKLNNYQVDRKTQMSAELHLFGTDLLQSSTSLNPAVGLIGKAGELYGNVEVKIDLIIHDVSIKSDLGK